MNTTPGNVINSSAENASQAAREEDDPEASLYDVAAKMYTIVFLVLVIVGCIGNILSFLVSVRKNQRKSSVSVFVAALAVWDSSVLVLDFLNNWFRRSMGIYLLKNIHFCLFHRWIFRVAFTTPSWLVAGVAVERFIAVFFPLTAKVWCTVKNAIIATILIPIALSLIFFFNVFAWQIKDGKCDIKPYYNYFTSVISPWIMYSLYSYAPLLVIFFCNIAITFNLAKSDQQRSSMTPNAVSSDTKKITIMVMVICLTFCITTIPVSIWYLWIFASRQFIKQTARITLIQMCIQLLSVSNHCINFFLYVLTSQRFRADLKMMFSYRFETQEQKKQYPAVSPNWAMKNWAYNADDEQNVGMDENRPNSE